MANLTVQIDWLPQSVDEFLEMRDRIAGTPQGGAATMVVALMLFAQDENLGKQCLTIAVDRDLLQEGPNGYQGMQLGIVKMRLIMGQLRAMPHIPRSYIQGATPENGYQLPDPPYIFNISTNPYSGDVESGTFKVYIASSGAASPRPITLQQNNRGIWKAAEWSSILVGVEPPVVQEDDPL